MNLLVAAVLVLGQAVKPPSERSVKLAEKKLERSPGDTRANLTMGVYCWTRDEIDKALPYLAKGSDRVIARAAKRDLQGADNELMKIEVGDEWIKAAAKSRKLRFLASRRAIYWYAEAWPDLNDVWKTKMRERFHAIARVPANYMKRQDRGKPSGWPNVSDYWGSFLDTSFSHSGRASLKILQRGKDNKVRSGAQSEFFPVRAGKTYRYSAWVFSTETDGDLFIHIACFDKSIKVVSGSRILGFQDRPWWTKVEGEITAPDGSVRAHLIIAAKIEKGALWIDDASVTVDGKEILKNGDFEK